VRVLEGDRARRGHHGSSSASQKAMNGKTVIPPVVNDRVPRWTW
jgi:hypothetical protein